MHGVIVNGRCLARPTTGVERYAREVTRCLAGRVQIASPDASRPGLRGHLWEQLSLPSAVNGHLLWSPANTGPLSVRNQVVTIHDISPLEHPEWFAPDFAAWYRYLLPRLARRARRVITVSEFTRARVVERLEIPAGRVTVIPHGVASCFQPQPPTAIDTVRHRYQLAAPYLLVVGSLQPRKNLERLLRVWRRIQGAWHGLELVIIGRFGAGFRPLRLDAHIDRVRLLGGVPDADLAAIYTGALGFLQPSLYEGFGLPVLEAMACSLPVASSNTSALPEVSGEAAVFMDPSDDESMAAAIRQLVEDESWRAHSRCVGMARARQFTWERTASRTWQVLQQAAEDRA